MHSLEVEYDPVNDTIMIEGTRYSGDLFRELGCNFPSMVGDIIRIDEKEDGLVTITKMETKNYRPAWLTHTGT
jgi:hypothetical protein